MCREWWWRRCPRGEPTTRPTVAESKSFKEILPRQSSRTKRGQKKNGAALRQNGSCWGAWASPCCSRRPVNPRYPSINLSLSARVGGSSRKTPSTTRWCAPPLRGMPSPWLGFSIFISRELAIIKSAEARVRHRPARSIVFGITQTAPFGRKLALVITGSPGPT